MADDSKQPMNLRIDPDLFAELKAIRDAEGIPVSEQIRRGIRLWLDQKGATPKAKRATKARGKRS